MNLRDRCVARLADLMEELRDLHPDDLDSEELLTYVREGAAHLERFVKQLAIKPSGSSLFDYINELGKLGLGKMGHRCAACDPEGGESG